MVTIFFSEQISNIVNINEFLLIPLLLYSYTLFIITFYTSDLNLEFKYKKITFLNLKVAIIGTILSIIAISLMSEYKYIGRIIGLLLPNLLFAIYIFVYYFKGNKIELRSEYIKFALSILYLTRSYCRDRF